ncbi:MAG TPA: rhomboid family intramembrane serine protease [Prochlorococcus sp.]
MISIVCLFFYGGTLYSLIPGVSPAGVSWIGHISGFGGGALAAFSVYKEP